MAAAVPGAGAWNSYSGGNYGGKVGDRSGVGFYLAGGNCEGGIGSWDLAVFYGFDEYAECWGNGGSADVWLCGGDQSGDFDWWDDRGLGEDPVWSAGCDFGADREWGEACESGAVWCDEQTAGDDWVRIIWAEL